MILISIKTSNEISMKKARHYSGPFWFQLQPSPETYFLSIDIQQGIIGLQYHRVSRCCFICFYI